MDRRNGVILVMPSRFSRMSQDERMKWAEKEARLRALGFDPAAERIREQQVGATSSEAGRALRRLARIIRGQNGSTDVDGRG